MNIKESDEGKVMLIAGGGEVYTDTVARFVKSERELEEIIASPTDKNIIKNIIDSGHEAALEFDWFIFGVEGYSRVTEVQLVRKRIASYMIKSGRVEHNGERSFNVVIPESIEKHFIMDKGEKYDYTDILRLIKKWYNKGVELGIPEEDLRYLKPQATEFKAAIGMNARALKDFFKVRCCKRAQHEIRDMANKMLKICKKVNPELFKSAGPNCVELGYCPENDMQHEDCNVITKNEMLKLIKEKSE